MNADTAPTAKPLTVAERKARLAQLVAEDKVSPEHAKLIDIREPTAREIETAKTLVPLARRALARYA